MKARKQNEEDDEEHETSVKKSRQRKKMTLSSVGKSQSLAVPVDIQEELDDEEEEEEARARNASREVDASTGSCCIEEPVSAETTTGNTGSGEGGAGLRQEATESTSLVTIRATTSGNQVNQVISNRESMEAKRERKAAKTLVIITGAFVGCWLPFFITALVLPICGDSCPLPDFVFSVFLWLGYMNSMINPIIYTIFSMDFRIAFKKILFGRRFRQNNANTACQRNVPRPAHV